VAGDIPSPRLGVVTGGQALPSGPKRRPEQFWAKEFPITEEECGISDRNPKSTIQTPMNNTAHYRNGCRGEVLQT
jgi:hypothetical protein